MAMVIAWRALDKVAYGKIWGIRLLHGAANVAKGIIGARRIKEAFDIRQGKGWDTGPALGCLMKKELRFWLYIIFIAFILTAYSRSYAEIYRYVDENGVWHFSNVLIPGSEYEPFSPQEDRDQDGSASSVTPTRREVLRVQIDLKSIGYNPGEIDGIWGNKTENALKKFQKDNGLEINGRLDRHTKLRLKLVTNGVDVEKAQKIGGKNIEGISRPVSASRNSNSNPYPAGAIPQYGVFSMEDVSYAGVPRRSYRVQVPREMTKKELTAISQEIVRQATSHKEIKAIMIFYFLPDSDTDGAFTAGKAVWAPEGDWSKSSTDLEPRLVVQAGSAMGTISKKNVVDLPVSKKKQIFMQIVRNQDIGMDDKESHSAAARRFGITTDQAKKISTEGIIKGWPMP